MRPTPPRAGAAHGSLAVLSPRPLTSSPLGLLCQLSCRAPLLFLLSVSQRRGSRGWRLERVCAARLCGCEREVEAQRVCSSAEELARLHCRCSSEEQTSTRTRVRPLRAPEPTPLSSQSLTATALPASAVQRVPSSQTPDSPAANLPPSPRRASPQARHPHQSTSSSPSTPQPSTWTGQLRPACSTTCASSSGAFSVRCWGPLRKGGRGMSRRGEPGQEAGGDGAAYQVHRGVICTCSGLGAPGRTRSSAPARAHKHPAADSPTFPSLPTDVHPHSTSVSLLYPLYASYKALRPAASSGLTPQEQGERLERWLMYWCVVACVWTWEQWGEWSVAWCALLPPLFSPSQPGCCLGNEAG